MRIFDTHAHYDDPKFDEDRNAVLRSLVSAGVERCINIGCDVETSVQSCEISSKYDFVYTAVGIHPSELGETEGEIDEQICEIKNLAQKNSKVVAIGEIGLDYYWEKGKKELQKYAFVKQIELANELGLPISIHTRDAIDDTIGVLMSTKVAHGGVLHCCPFNRELVRHGLDVGLHVAFGGTCTFKNAKNADEIIGMVPLERILVETDSPYLAPDPLRGTRNDSRNLVYVISKLASVKGVSPEKMAEITYENAEKLFLDRDI